MTKYQKQFREWRKRNQKIYKEVMAGKMSQRKIAMKYGLSNTRIAQIVKQVEETLDKTVQ